METLDRFEELGPELHIIMHYDVPLGWYGAATWCDEKGNDVCAIVPMDDEWWNERFESFIEELYRRATLVKNGRSA